MLQFLETKVIKKEAEVILKYKDVIIEIQRMRNVEAKVMAVIVRATGTISKLLRKYLSQIPGKHKVKELRRTATLGTAPILWKVLMLKYAITLHVAQIVKKVQLQHCIP